MAKLHLAAALLSTFLAGCVHREPEPTIAMPTAIELSGYVSRHWAAEFRQRFSRFAGRVGQPSEFVRVDDARCTPNWGGQIAECAYEVTAKFDSGDPVTRELWSQFERRDDGALNEVLIISHERRRGRD